MTSCQPVSSSWVTNIVIVATALGAFTFVAAYAWRTRGAWRGSAVGVNVMAFMSAVLVVSCLAVAGIVFGTNWPYREAIRACAWGLIAACILWRVAILLRVQHRDRTDTVTAPPRSTTPGRQTVWTRNFWLQAAERAVKTFAGSVAGLLGADGLDLFDLDWGDVFGAAGLTVLVSLALSVASAPVGEPGDPSAVARTDSTT